MPAILGLTLVKINGIYNLKVKNSKWGLKRAVSQAVTGGGIKTGLGFEMVAGSWEETIEIAGNVDVASLVDFTLQIYDQPTQKLLVFAAERCNWESIDGSNDLQAATSSKGIAWKGEKRAGLL